MDKEKVSDLLGRALANMQRFPIFKKLKIMIKIMNSKHVEQTQFPWSQHHDGHYHDNKAVFSIFIV